MSAFLGPIHYMMYNKILKNEEIVDSIIDISINENIMADLKEHLDKECGIVAKGDLENIIDLSNIHSWLSSQVNITEKRLALAVKLIISSNSSNISLLENLFYTKGEEAYNDHASIIVAGEFFKVLHTILLDGMPCDAGVSVQNDDEDNIMWEVSLSSHKPYWDSMGADVSLYFHLRDKWLEGFFKNSSITYTRMGINVFSISEG